MESLTTSKIMSQFLQLFLCNQLLYHITCEAVPSARTDDHTEGPGPPTETLIHTGSAQEPVNNGSTYNISSMPQHVLPPYNISDSYGQAGNYSFFLNATANTLDNNVSESETSKKYPKKINVLRKLSNLELGTNAYVIILLSAVVIVTFIFTIFGLFMKAEAHSKSDIRSALLFEDKNLFGFAGLNVDSGFDTSV